MATLVTLSLFKKHVYADEFIGDSDLLQHYLDAAEGQVLTDTGRSAAELLEMGGGSTPAQIAQAIIMLGAHWYNQRESDAGVQMHGVSRGYNALVKPFTSFKEYGCNNEETP